MNKEQLFKDLLALKQNAYVKYSNFRVACIIEMKDHTIIKGVNVESVAYSPTICAERAAIAQMYAQGYSKNDVANFSLYTDSVHGGTPCGVCRQVMNELLVLDQPIHIFNKNGFFKSIINADLLPYAFSDKELYGV